MDDCCSAKGTTIAKLGQSEARRVLMVVMIVNAVMFVGEFGFGLIARSSAMMADSVDMLGDAVVYGLSLHALDRSAQWQAGAALAKGGLILTFGVAIFAQTVFEITAGATPSAPIMLVVTGMALAANLLCLLLLWRFRSMNVNMASTFECSRNDVIANVGVLVAAGLVAWTRTGWPDIAVGLIIACLFLRSALRVLRTAWPIWRGHSRQVLDRCG